MLRSLASRILPRSHVLVLLAAFTLAAHAAPGRAADGPPTDPTARAEWLSGQAEAAFSERRFADAIRLYLDAWEAAPAASILYNVAFIYDKRLNDPELAIDYYERAAASSDADDDIKVKARTRVVQLRAELAKPDKPPEKPPEKPKQPKPANPGPWIVTVTGGALLLGGVVMAFIAQGTESDFDAASNAADKRDLQDQGRTEALSADLLMGTGVAAIGVGVVWMLVASGSDDGDANVGPVPESRLRFEPRFIPGGAALVLGGTL